jgi:hypothetical protein
MANGDEISRRQQMLAQAVGGSLRGLGAGVVAGGAAPGQISSDISMPILTSALEGITGKIGGLLGVAGDKAQSKLMEKYAEKTANSVEKAAESLGEIEASEKETVEQLSLFNDNMAAERRAETESSREKGVQDPTQMETGGESTEQQQSTGWFKWLLGLLGTLSGLLLTNFDQLFSKFGKFYDDFITPLTTRFKTLYDDAVKPFIESISARFSTLYDEVAKPFFESISTKFSTLYDDVVTKFIKPVSKELLEEGRYAVEGIVEGLAKKFPNLASFMKGTAETAADLAAKGGGGLKTAAETTVGFLGRLKSAATDIGQRVTSSAPARVLTRLGGAVSDMAGTAVKGFAKGSLGLIKKIPVIGPAIESFFLKGKYDALKAALDQGIINEAKFKSLFISEMMASLGALLGGTAGAIGGGGVASLGLAVAGGMAGERLARKGAYSALGVSEADAELASRIFYGSNEVAESAPGSTTTVVAPSDNSTTVVNQGAQSADTTARTASDGDVAQSY